MTGDSRFVQYYSDPFVREKIQYQRKCRYHEDPQARAEQLARVKARRAKEKKEPTETKKRAVNHRRVFEVDGFPVIMVSLGDAAKQVGLSKKGFRTLDDDAVIPRNRLVDRLGRRWYPSDFIEWLVPLLCEQGKKREPKWIVRERVERAWETSTATRIGERHG